MVKFILKILLIGLDKIKILWYNLYYKKEIKLVKFILKILLIGLDKIKILWYNLYYKKEVKKYMFYSADFELLDRLNCELSEYIIKIENRTLTKNEFKVAKKIFYEYVFRMTNTNLFSMYMLINIKNRQRYSSLKKKRGDYTIPDRVIDGVIAAIVSGETVDVACKFAGITKSTLYNRIKSRGYADVKSFFKNRRLN